MSRRVGVGRTSEYAWHATHAPIFPRPCIPAAAASPHSPPAISPIGSPSHRMLPGIECCREPHCAHDMLLLIHGIMVTRAGLVMLCPRLDSAADYVGMHCLSALSRLSAFRGGALFESFCARELLQRVLKRYAGGAGCATMVHADNAVGFAINAPNTRVSFVHPLESSSLYHTAYFAARFGIILAPNRRLPCRRTQTARMV